MSSIPLKKKQTIFREQNFLKEKKKKQKELKDYLDSAGIFSSVVSFVGLKKKKTKER
jgi:hypothetical protein